MGLRQSQRTKRNIVRAGNIYTIFEISEEPISQKGTEYLFISKKICTLWIKNFRTFGKAKTSEKKGAQTKVLKQVCWQHS